MHPTDTLESLEQLIRSRSILKHPFYRAWQRGELSREQLVIYARVYYPHVAAFPRYLKSAIDSAEDPLVKKELEANLLDELSNPKAHTELWLDFAAGFGHDRASITHQKPHPSAEKMVATFERLAQQGSPAALAALYAYESQQPEVARQKADGLRAFYGVDDPKTLAYFEVHAEADRRHREGERTALTRCLQNGVSTDEVLTAARHALDAYWQLLDGVCTEAGIPLTC